jgi:hypothetical protein
LSFFGKQAEFPVSSRVTATAIALSGMTIDPGLSEFEETAIADNKAVASEKGSIVPDRPIALGFGLSGCSLDAESANFVFNAFISSAESSVSYSDTTASALAMKASYDWRLAKLA